MKKLVLILVVILSACAVPRTDPRIEAHWAWVNATRDKALAGQIKWADYYTESFERLAALPPHPIHAFSRKQMAEMIPIARKYDAGEMSKDEFYDIRRKYGAEYDTYAAGLIADANRRAEEQRQRNIENTDRAMRILQSTQTPDPVLPQPQFPVRCRSVQTGNVTQTVCN